MPEIMREATFHPDSHTDGPPGYRERSGQLVTVIDELGEESDPDVAEGDVAPLYRIRFEDGVETEAFGDELEPSPMAKA